MQTIASLTVLTAVVISVSAAAPRIDNQVHRTLQRQGAVNIMVTLEDTSDAILKSLRNTAFPSRRERIIHGIDRLQSEATKRQAPILQLLARKVDDQLASDVRAFWISNQVYFKDATFELIQKLSLLPGVKSVSEEAVISHDDAIDQTTSLNATRALSSPVEWGVERIQAPLAWASGAKGDGVVIGHIDSGVRWTHEAVRGRFRREFGWYDPIKKTSEPYDIDGHGTHTLGTLVGAGGIGVAPNAQWISCKPKRDDDGTWTESKVLECMQFMACPTDPTGTIKDCTQAPHVVSNSWGFYGKQAFQKAVDTWVALGIVPVFAIGNDGRDGCKIVQTPGAYANVISVGQTEANDGLAAKGQRGTASSSQRWSHLARTHARPQLSATLSSDSRHVECRYNNLPPAAVECSATKNGVFPNNMYGYGRVNAFKALQANT